MLPCLFDLATFNLVLRGKVVCLNYAYRIFEKVVNSKQGQLSP